MRLPHLVLCALGVCLVPLGCSQGNDAAFRPSPGTAGLASPASGPLGESPAASVQQDGGTASPVAGGEGSAVALEQLNRHIVYTASVQLTVDDFGTFPERLIGLLSASGGYISEAKVDRMQGSSRNGSWTLRVPGSRYRDFIRELCGLGVPESVIEKANDVTDQLVDLEARITSMKKLEAQIMKLVEKQNDRLDSVLSLERELARVRVDIERLEGSLRVIADQVSLSTIALVALERQVFVAVPPASFDTRVGSAWSGAVMRARIWWEGLLLATITHCFTIIGWLVFLAVAWWLVGRRLLSLAWRQLLPPVRPAASS